MDISEHVPQDVEYIRADATSENFWNEIELENFDATVVALPRDLDAIFCILMIKRRVSSMPVYVRCNKEYVEKLYKAGADCVINSPVVAAENDNF